MIGSIFSLSAYYNPYQSVYGPQQRQTQGVQPSSTLWAAQKAAQPESPVQPVTPVRPVIADENILQTAMLRYDSDPAAMAVRMRIQYLGDAAQQTQNPGQGQEKPLPGLPGQADNKAVPESAQKGDEVKSAQEVMEEGECQTCKERKYQDASDDPGVSFKTPTNVAPNQAAAAVRGHENEHVIREQAKARRENRRVVSQYVTYHTGICPECGKAYVSGGTTRTVTKANTEQDAAQQQEQQSPRTPFAAVACN